ncbi:23S rRNA pseudouridine(1911/1915/1917) synthase RluD [Teredinibacter haidensis]|uniref:23S rRNA pseudouridine(1911/1915/1917) synthase RluD n=1 Tax=Teredinibacter haidensis TaxID=2731755 RepID=UPI0009489F4C|nr:23S rRNA pseudouridine(1911/1915/1917) synthase RluD [Teredinibacter haidensis]
MPAETLFSEGEDNPSKTDGREPHQHQVSVPFNKAGSRLDQFASEMFPQYSRSRLQQWIKDGALTLDDQLVKPKTRLVGGESLHLEVREVVQGEWLPENIAVPTIYEDETLWVVNKPAGLVVHPAAGNYTGTLLNGLLYHCAEQAKIPRAGIVHRLDKDTSGLMVVAKTSVAQLRLVEQLQARTVKRQYQALVQGNLRSPGSVDAPIGRHPSQRTKMAVVNSGGKEAITHYKPVKKFDDFTLVELKLETGRTHQIRVHMAHLGFPLVGDPTYGRKMPAKLLRARPELQLLADFPRQALHAARLGLTHPTSNEHCEWRASAPDDMLALIDLLEQGV